MRRRNIRIKVRLHQGGGELRFDADGVKPLEIDCHYPENHFADKRRPFFEALDNARKCLSGDLVVNEYDSVLRAFQEVLAKGRVFLAEISGNSYGEPSLPQIEEFFRQAMPGWCSPGDPLKSVEEPPTVELESSPAETIPWEFLPVFDTSNVSNCRSAEDLERIAQRFLGFSAVVRRRFPWQRVPTNVYLDNENGMNVKLFHHVDLSGIGSEADFSRQNYPQIRLDGPWPDRELAPEEIVRMLAWHLWHSDTNFDGQKSEKHDHVHHFACHCEFVPHGSAETCLILAHAPELSQRITLDDLKHRFLVEQWAPVDKAIRPLVFLNACESAVLDNRGIAPFPDFFLTDLGSRAFLGAEAKVPVKFAPAFAQSVYGHLFRGFPLGHAVYLAKWEFLRKFRNPLGILYTVYGSTDLRLRRPATIVNVL